MLGDNLKTLLNPGTVSSSFEEPVYEAIPHVEAAEVRDGLHYTRFTIMAMKSFSSVGIVEGPSMNFSMAWYERYTSGWSLSSQSRCGMIE